MFFVNKIFIYTLLLLSDRNHKIACFALDDRHFVVQQELAAPG